MNKLDAVATQVRAAIAGVLAGTEETLTPTIEGICKGDTRFRHLRLIRRNDSRTDPSKKAGQVYEVLVTGKGPVKGTRTAGESLQRAINNSLVTLYCVDGERRQSGPGAWRTFHASDVVAIEVYNGDSYAHPTKPGKTKAKRVWVDVVPLRPL